MIGASLAGEAEVRATATFCGASGTEEAGKEAGEGSAVDRVTALGVNGAGGGAGALSRFAPHMPQKRFSSEFSLPQRVQRTVPPDRNI
jgi:hypothetical protein